MTPRVLSMASLTALGAISLVAGIGMLLGGVVMTVWTGARRPVRLVFAVTLVQGVMLAVAGASHGLIGLGAAAFAYMFTVPVQMGTNQAIWLRVVPVEIQGSVLGLRRATEGGAIPLAALVAGPLVEHVFDRLLAGDSALAHAAARLVDTTPGRGIALMYIALGAVTVLAAAAALVRAQRSDEPAAVTAPPTLTSTAEELP